MLCVCQQLASTVQNVLTAAVYAVQVQPLQQLISTQPVTVYFHKSSLPRHSIVFSCVKPLVFLRLHWTVIQLSWTHAYNIHLVGVCVCVSLPARTSIPCKGLQIPGFCLAVISTRNKKLCCCKEAARCFVSVSSQLQQYKTSSSLLLLVMQATDLSLRAVKCAVVLSLA